MSDIKHCLKFGVYVFTPLLIISSTISAAFYFDRDHICYKINRDFGQVLYFCVALAGLTGYQTGIRILRNRISFDVVCVSLLAASCLIMSLTTIQDVIPKIFFILMETIANVSGSFYILMLVARHGHYR
jgi:hypothetical protein